MVSEVILSIPLPWTGPNPDDLQKVINNYLKLVLEKRKKKLLNSSLQLIQGFAGLTFLLMSHMSLSFAKHLLGASCVKSRAVIGLGVWMNY